MASTTGIRAGRAFVEIGGNETPLVKALRSGERQLRAFGSEVQKIGAGMAAIGAAVTAPLALATKHFADIGSELADMSSRTGVSVEALSSLGYAAAQTGADAATLETGIRKMQRSIADAAGGSKTANDALAGLGLTVADLAGQKPEKQFRTIAASLKGVADPTERAALAMELLGKSGTALLPMIGDMATLEDQAARLGVTMSTTDAAAADALGDAMDNVRQAVGGLANKIGAALAPAITALAGNMATSIAVAGEWAREHERLVQIAGAAGVAFTAAGAGLATFGVALQTIGPAVKALGVAVAALTSPVALVVGGLAAVGGAFIYAGTEGDTLSEKFQNLSNAIMPAVAETTAFIKSAWASVSEFLAPVVTAATEAIRIAWAALSEAIQPFVTSATDFVISSWASVEPYVLPILTSLQDAVVTTFGTAAFAIKNFEAIAAAGLLGTAYQVVRLGNEIEYVFGEAIPGYLGFFLNHWREIFTDVYEFTKTVFSNMWDNILNFFNGVAAWLSGEEFSFEWTGLTEGFRSTLQELPKIAEREIGALEADLKQQFDAIAKDLGVSFDSFMGTFRSKVTGAATGGAPAGGATGGAPGLFAAARFLQRAPAIPDTIARQFRSGGGTFNAANVFGLGGGSGKFDKVEKHTAKLENMDKNLGRIREGIERIQFQVR